MTLSSRRCLGSDLRSPDPPTAASAAAELRQGDCIALRPDLAAGDHDPSGCGQPAQGGATPPQLYQVIGIDAPGNRCWLRRWPLARHGSPVFELPLQHLQPHDAHRPAPGPTRA